MNRLIPLAASAALLLACDPPTYDPGVVAEEGLPAIRISFPNPGLADSTREEMPVCPDFNVVVQQENFEFSHENYDGDPISGEGHWHLHVDDAALATPVSAVADPFASAPTLEPGPHTLYAVLVQNNHLRLPESMVDPDTPQDVHAVEIIVVPFMDDEGEPTGCVGGGGGGGGYSMDTGDTGS